MRAQPAAATAATATNTNTSGPPTGDGTPPPPSPSQDKEGDKLAVKPGVGLVDAVSDGLIGMQPGGRRRVRARERVWVRQWGAVLSVPVSVGLLALVSAQELV